MNADEQALPEEEVTAFLAACDDALADGATPEHLSKERTPPALQPRLERNLDCARRLRRLLGNSSKSTAAPQTAAGPLLAPVPASIGRFQIVRELGRGGFGVVFLANDTHLRREVALKVPRMDVLVTAPLRERFHQEARAAAGLDHPNIVQVFEVGEVGPICFIASAYCPGVTLADWLKTRREPVAFAEAAGLMATLAEAVQHAHERGVLHRDLKPGNILLVRWASSLACPAEEGKQGGLPHQPKITDFGLAKMFLEDQPADQTKSGVILGTPAYMAPEQAGGKSRDVGTPTDLYALGTILYELLTGRPPFRGETSLETLFHVKNDEPLPPSKLRRRMPRDLETICLKCLQKEPRKRYRSAAALADDLRRFLNGRPIQARPTSIWERGVKWARRRPAVAASLLSVLLVSLMGFAGILSQWLRAEEKAAAEARANAQLERTLYFNRIALAEREYAANNVGRAEELLDECPEHLRGWEWHYLKRLRHAGPVTLTGRQVFVLSPDGQHLATPTSNDVKIWDMTARRDHCLLKGHTAPIPALAFRPTGRHLASASRDRTVRIWDVTTGQELQVLRGHTGEVCGVTYSPDGQLLASVAADGIVKVWDTESGREILTLPGVVSSLQIRLKAAFSPDGRRLAAGSGDNAVKVWDTRTGEEICTLTGHTEFIPFVVYSPNGRCLASTSRDNTVKLWDLATCREIVTVQGHPGTIDCAVFSSEGQHLAVGLYDGTIKVVETATGRQIHSLLGHSGIVYGVAFTPDARRLASVSWDKTVKLWDTESGQEALTLRGHDDLVQTVAFNSDGRRLVSGGGRDLRIWDCTPLEANFGRRQLTLHGHTGFVYGVAFSPDGQRIATGSQDQTVKTWDAATGRVLLTLNGHTRPVFSVAFSPDGRHLASSSQDRTAKVWNADTGQEVFTLRRSDGMPRSVAYSPNGQFVATSGMQSVQVWDAATGQQVRTLRGPLGQVHSVVFSPDNRHIALANAQETVQVWDVATGAECYTLRGHTSRVYSAAYSSNGKYLASGAGDRLVKIWDVATGKEVRTLIGHTHYVWGMAFSPDSTRLASASWGEVKLWDTATYSELETLRGHAGLVWSVAFSPDGRRLAAASGYAGKGEVIVWDVTEGPREQSR